MLNNLFKPKLSHGTLPSHVKKALGNLKMTGLEFEQISVAAKALRLKFQSPGVVGETAVHFAFPKYKFAIIFESNSAIHERKVRETARSGWQLIVMKPRLLAHFTNEQITAQLKDFIDVLKSSQKQA